MDENKIKCPNCNTKVEESKLIASFLTDSLLCCPHCKNKSKHFVIVGTDPVLVFNEAQAMAEKKGKGKGR